jgi:hypothetical protein
MEWNKTTGAKAGRQHQLAARTHWVAPRRSVVA